jgi:hypothetical protein
MRFAQFALAFALASSAVACGGRLGPLVTDVRYGAGGELLVTRCMLDISSGGNFTTYDMRDCKRTIQPPPGARLPVAPPVAAPPPTGASATTVQ